MTSMLRPYQDNGAAKSKRQTDNSRINVRLNNGTVVALDQAQFDALQLDALQLKVITNGATSRVNDNRASNARSNAAVLPVDQQKLTAAQVASQRLNAQNILASNNGLRVASQAQQLNVVNNAQRIETVGNTGTTQLNVIGGNTNNNLVLIPLTSEDLAAGVVPAAEGSRVIGTVRVNQNANNVINVQANAARISAAALPSSLNGSLGTQLNTVQNGNASAASNDGNTAVDGSDAFAQSRGQGAAVSNAAGSAFIAGQGTVAASGTTDGGLVVAIVCQNGAATSNTRNFPVLVGGQNGNVFTPNQIAANPGDTVSFVFGSSNHSVTQSTFGNPCVGTAGGIDTGFQASTNLLASADTTGAPVLQYTVTSTTPEWFFCGQTGHCAQDGMVFAVNPPADETFTSFANIAQANVDVVTQTVTQTFTAAEATANSGLVDLLGNPISSALVGDTGIQSSGLGVSNLANTTLLSLNNSTECLEPANGQAINNYGGCYGLLSIEAATDDSTTATTTSTGSISIATGVNVAVSGNIVTDSIVTSNSAATATNTIATSTSLPDTNAVLGGIVSEIDVTAAATTTADTDAFGGIAGSIAAPTDTSSSGSLASI